MLGVTLPVTDLLLIFSIGYRDLFIAFSDGHKIKTTILIEGQFSHFFSHEQILFIKLHYGCLENDYIHDTTQPPFVLLELQTR